MSKVHLYVYDLSGGLASAFSAQLLGRRIDAIWHTAIVVFNREYFYGGDGISFVPPGGTVLGQPLEIIEMGTTQVTQELLENAMGQWADNRFRGDKYDLFEHNCNTFSNELCQFLVNKSIPSHIISLPSEVLATPFGNMIKTYMKSAETVHARAGTTEGHIRGSASRGAPSSSHTRSRSRSPNRKKDGNNSASLRFEPILYQEPLQDYVRTYVADSHSASQWREDIMKLYEFLQKEDTNEDDAPIASMALIEIVYSPEADRVEQEVVMELYRLFLWKCPHLMLSWLSDESRPFERLLHRWQENQTLSSRLLIEGMIKFWTNCLHLSLNWNLSPDVELPLDQLAEFDVKILEDLDNRVYSLGLSLNLALHYALSEDAAMQLGTFLIHLAQDNKTTFPPTAYDNLVTALYLLMQKNIFLVELAKVQELQLLEADDLVSSRIRDLMENL